MGEKFNHLYVQFYNNYCQYGNPDGFEEALNQWLSLAQDKNLGIFIGLPAAEGAAGNGYLTPEEMDTMYSVRISTVIESNSVLRV